MDIQGLPDDVFHRHTWIQGGVGILKDHLHLFPHGGDVLLRYLLPTEENVSPRGLVETEKGPSYRGLAAAGLADESQRLSLSYGEGDIIHRLQETGFSECLAHGKISFEVIDLQ